MRPSWDEYFGSLARLTASRASCPRAQVGCVLVRDNHVLSSGYNGSMRGAPSCLEVGCLMPHGSCIRTQHAEVNAIIQAARHGVSTIGATAYCTHSPCRSCMGALVNAGVLGIKFLELYRISEHLEEARQLGISVEQI